MALVLFFHWLDLFTLLDVENLKSSRSISSNPTSAEQMNEGDIGDLDAKKRLDGIRKILIA